MEFKVENGDGIDSWKEVTLVYSAALRQMETKMQILNDEFQHVHQYNPIEHIKARIKTPESIVKKLKRYGQESTIDNMVKYINDIAGIRIYVRHLSHCGYDSGSEGHQSDRGEGLHYLP